MVSGGASLEKLYFVIKCIDEQVENDMKCRASKIHGFWKYSSLNELCKDEVKVIPKIRDTFLQNEEGKFVLMDPNHNEYSLFREPSECFASSIDELMNNYMIRDKRHLEQFPFTIFRVDEDSLLGKHFELFKMTEKQGDILIDLISSAEDRLWKYLMFKRQERLESMMEGLWDSSIN